MELITLTTKTRGRNTREVEYQGIGRIERKETKTEDGKVEVEESVVVAGVLPSFADALALPGIAGNTQTALDMLADGYNRAAREAALDVDEFAGFIQPEWDEETTSQYKRAVRALAKVSGLEFADVAEMVLSKMKKPEPANA